MREPVITHQPGRARVSWAACNQAITSLASVQFSVHHGKLTGTRQTVILGAKLSSFVKILGLLIQVESDLDIQKPK